MLQVILLLSVHLKVILVVVDYIILEFLLQVAVAEAGVVQEKMHLMIVLQDMVVLEDSVILPDLLLMLR